MNTDLEDLEDKIKKAKQDDPKAQSPSKKAQTISADSRAGIQAGVELVGSIAISTALGVGLDRWLDTSPIFLILLFFMGVFAGFFNVYRVLQNLGSTVGYSELHRREKNAKTAPEQEEPSDTNKERSGLDNKE